MEQYRLWWFGQLKWHILRLSFIVLAGEMMLDSQQIWLVYCSSSFYNLLPQLKEGERLECSIFSGPQCTWMNVIQLAKIGWNQVYCEAYTKVINQVCCYITLMELSYVDHSSNKSKFFESNISGLTFFLIFIKCGYVEDHMAIDDIHEPTLFL